MSRLLIPITLSYLIHLVYSQCQIGDHTFNNGEHWMQDKYFNVTCRRGQISVLNCITDKGTYLPVGSLPYIEDGITYNCEPAPDPDGYAEYDPYYASDPFEGAGLEQVPLDCADGRATDRYAGFVLCCVTNRIIGCVDAENRTVRADELFLAKNMALKLCKIMNHGKKGRIENKGCFNGTSDVPLTDKTFHVPKYTIWTTENRAQLRCGDDGIRVYKCPLTNNGLIHTGSAWLDEDNNLNVCG
uniref:Secreted protein n=1 Tax=Panagrellus redivivus TaxID=6233 RepID=A0A7E4VEI3_PANRE